MHHRRVRYVIYVRVSLLHVLTYLLHGAESSLRS